MKPKNWVSMLGNYEVDGGTLWFRGGSTLLSSGSPTSQIGNFISDLSFGGGTISSTILFTGDTTDSAVGLILYYHPETGAFVEAQLGGEALASLRTFASGQWTTHQAHGPSVQLRPNTEYQFKVRVIGSRVTVTLNEIQIIDSNLPFTLPRGQAGVWATGQTDIAVKDFDVVTEKPRLFVVMQFSDPFNELYSDVIQSVGDELGFVVSRADETYGPGLIIADITRDIAEAKAIVADITPNNANVFFEVGYAYALQKETILIAERDTNLPFDLSSFRTLFYENTIAGKTRIEEGLRKNLMAIQSRWMPS